MRLQKRTSVQTEDKPSNNDSGFSNMTTDETVGDNTMDEYRKSLDLLADVFCDLPKPNPVDSEQSNGSEQFSENDYHSDAKQQSPSIARDILAHLATGGMSEYPKNDLVQDLVKDTNMDWSDSSKALLQLVHTDHPYLSKSQVTDDSQQTPAQSNSCSSIPDAELIHDFFLHTTNMIAYRPIAEVGNQPVPNTATTLIGSPQLQPNANVVPTLFRSPGIVNRSFSKSEDVPLSGNICVSKQGSMSQDNMNMNMKDDSNVSTTNENLKISDLSDTQNNGTVGQEKEPKDTSCYETKTSQEHACETKTQSKKKTNDDEGQRDNKTRNEEKVDECESQAGSDVSEEDSQTSSQDKGSTALTTMVQSPSLDEWTAACKAVTDKVQEESLLNCAMNLMLKVWTEYLTLTFEEVRQREIETARELNYCDDVIEMLEDKDRYVWQIIEEMKPRNFSMEF